MAELRSCLNNGPCPFNGGKAPPLMVFKAGRAPGPNVPAPKARGMVIGHHYTEVGPPVPEPSPEKRYSVMKTLLSHVDLVSSLHNRSPTTGMDIPRKGAQGDKMRQEAACPQPDLMTQPHSGKRTV
ncbi:hypothetical protein mRhiFer1_008983 [Rhinolophus ferrumequinum]|uniref:Uncharacterized protein n=1 Tax=Rhinolophus ferrumequinum TaxID=59479 RepID=A0A7J7TE19_RHIFE|nr:hypothetical protein mRhiFer1_008983 [Rhinolophus ferrumequinum]